MVGRRSFTILYDYTLDAARRAAEELLSEGDWILWSSMDIESLPNGAYDALLLL